MSVYFAFVQRWRERRQVDGLCWAATWMGFRFPFCGDLQLRPRKQRVILIQVSRTRWVEPGESVSSWGKKKKKTQTKCAEILSSEMSVHFILAKMLIKQLCRMSRSFILLGKGMGRMGNMFKKNTFTGSFFYQYTKLMERIKANNKATKNNIFISNIHSL